MRLLTAFILAALISTILPGQTPAPANTEVAVTQEAYCAKLTELGYPPIAYEKRLKGTVVVAVKLNKHGMPSSARLRKGLGYGLDETALLFAKNCSFPNMLAPAKPLGKTVLVRVQFDATKPAAKKP